MAFSEQALQSDAAPVANDRARSFFLPSRAARNPHRQSVAAS